MKAGVWDEVEDFFDDPYVPPVPPPSEEAVQNSLDLRETVVDNAGVEHEMTTTASGLLVCVAKTPVPEKHPILLVMPATKNMMKKSPLKLNPLFGVAIRTKGK